ncbi:M15 family metallopeptidase [Bacteroides helcogenes]|uniref:D-alanyl-D-alanine dipeptidase n=1 Tax=Bacteroides helcogenes (strain ATCC 35417 / DSM 20613 / JCM 6297 / CCUG 15421 / P 36-108) TaxID=693979 RepID=E6SPF8_BACT6|nr:M15 family metallopeptidase [Bacteroides helcogenes]ADV42847.1 peptidase M15D vanX D-ala-D-ala dipeptidase [Bacteroides helcogenes P 36-108]MDY5239076.1 M15 family metallopeptidase [Bacteroides helcogenes]
MKYILFYLYMLCILCSCGNGQKEPSRHIGAPEDSICSAQPVPAKSHTACYLDSLGFVNIAEADTSIAIELMYARADNFTGEVLYKDLHEAYLHPDAMKSLSEAQRLLKELHPDYSLIVYDAARPMHIQQKMWNVVKGTSRQIYVSNPARGGGLHNYGLAVDISILDEQGTPLSMGTPVDYLGREAHITQEEQLVKNGKLTAQERNNRLLLRQVMKKAGFRPLPSEWWHFNRYSRQAAKEKYQIIP